MMASLKFWFCLWLVLLSFSSSDQARPLAPLLDKSDNKEAMMESAKQVLEASIERQVGKPFETSKRSRPPPAPLYSKMSKQQALMQIKVLRASIASQAAAAGSGLTDSKRVSPGGPDGHHH
ncbi:unnamed protein product [Prunus brigantina]